MVETIVVVMEKMGFQTICFGDNTSLITTKNRDNNWYSEVGEELTINMTKSKIGGVIGHVLSLLISLQNKRLRSPPEFAQDASEGDLVLNLDELRFLLHMVVPDREKETEEPNQDLCENQPNGKNLSLFVNQIYDRCF
ncbi:hypothetical protein U1Q18_042173 [Sarracenia purpurea var. burkii]